MAYTNIDDPSAYFQTALYTGNATDGKTVTNDGNSDLQPDYVWTKCRSGSSHHTNVDSSRGVRKQIYPNLTYFEETVGGVSGFLTDGFTLGNNGTANSNGATYVAWQWKANGGTTASNTDGSINSTVQANQDAGFSIVTWAGTGVYNKTVGHGLGATPAVVIVKNRTTGDTSYDDWWMFHHKTSNPVNRVLALNENAAEVGSTVFWSVLPSSTIFGIGGSTNAPRYTNGASQNYVAYCFAEKQGYSKFGSYVGNGSLDGSFVYTGFKPAFLLVKIITASGYDWRLVDSTRNTFNLTDKLLMPNNTSAEFDGSTHASNLGFDFVSNGFKLRTTYTGMNGNTETFIYMAFAENPFVTSTGIPTTAR